MMDYKVGDSTFTFSYQEVREQYLILCGMTDDEFRAAIPRALHLACFICFVKEIPSYVCLRDDGIVHQLAHLLHIPDSTEPEFQAIRELFKDQLALA